MERVAVVTGASQGLGLALARSLAADGWSLVIDARREDLLAHAASDIAHAGTGGSTVVAVPGDVADAAHRAALAAAAKDLGPVRLVVNNASTLGASPLPALVDLDPATYLRTLEVNLVAPIALVAALADQLGDDATIVNVSSDAAVEPYEHWGGYGSSKAALDHASMILAEEHPSWRVLAIDPGDLDTELHRAAFPGEDLSDLPGPEAAVPGFRSLIDGQQGSGRYRAQELAR
ncbi:SDR family NAD(P)-dependent oxidoreductase [Aquihabitans sp. McL0605]|uniref:SDR family NAD(P)-dependent oxidoreductase n=1 Tax=Aquihabitans sp. McL0605 TaxID=3415671 RepID=UPI003CF2E5B4